ncbi:MAG: hypothetical protein CMQ26_02235 [Gammaproteobacteria bacterium]|jgi:hypothetical protein|nr:hypothetical protein [Gammaproteobacteria bacterium]MBS25878.1 hypothetical protein [Gammaproteobacteria bacterium]
MSTDSITLQARQERTTMQVTSVEFRDEETVITAQGEMGTYGTVYTSYLLKYDSSGNGGTVSGQGRGVVDKDTFFSGTFSGVWKRDGSNILMRNLVNISDGTTNLDSIVVNTGQRNLSIDVYVID